MSGSTKHLNDEASIAGSILVSKDRELQIIAEWQALQAQRAPYSNDEPTPEQLTKKKAHKAAVMAWRETFRFHPSKMAFVLALIKQDGPRPGKKPQDKQTGSTKKPNHKQPPEVPRQPATLPGDREVDYLCILDFEATCNDGGHPNPREIIEFPTLLFNVSTGEIEKEFHHYIRPDVHPQLSAFCTELTGITQECINNRGISLAQALHLHSKWLREDCGGIVPWNEKAASEGQKTFLYLTCGDWDLKTCLPQQLQYHGQTPDKVFNAWINIKKEFTKLYNRKATGMTFMLDYLGLELKGKHHSGIDDCRNIAQICWRMIEDGWIPSSPTNQPGR